MKVFLKYLILNIIMTLFHIVMFYVGAMGFGGGSGGESTAELLPILLIFAIFGASPNYVVFFFSLIRNKNIRLNLIWSTVFFLIVMVGYIIKFWSVIP